MPSGGSSKKGCFDSVLGRSLHIARAQGLIGERPDGIVDATGLESRHVSRYYVWRTGQPRQARLRWPKLTVVCHRQSHLFAGAFVCWGPCQDSPQLPPVLRQAAQYVHFDRLLGDKGYDAEHNHVLAREELGIRSTVIPPRKRNAWNRKWPMTKYRRQMKRRFPRRVYGQRWQVESAFSRHKRLLGSALRARHWPAQQAEMLLRVLTHNLMLLARSA